MKVLKAGTKVKTVIGELEAMVVGVCITMDTVEYKIRWLYNGAEQYSWVYRYELEVSYPKRKAGFNTENEIIPTDNEVTLISN